LTCASVDLALTSRIGLNYLIVVGILLVTVLTASGRARTNGALIAKIGVWCIALYLCAVVLGWVPNPVR
jgi:hypothetical protein